MFSNIFTSLTFTAIVVSLAHATALAPALDGAECCPQKLIIDKTDLELVKEISGKEGNIVSCL